MPSHALVFSFNRANHLVQAGRGLQVVHNEGLEAALGAGMQALNVLAHHVKVGAHVGKGQVDGEVGEEELRLRYTHSST